ERARTKVDEWLFWQMGGLGPMAGQASHFISYAPKSVGEPKLIEYGHTRYENELNRSCGVMERRCEERADLRGRAYALVDMASGRWARIAHKLGQNFDDFPKLKAWVDQVFARPAVQRALAAGDELRQKQELSKDQVRDMAKRLFGQTSASVNDAKSKQG